MSIINQMLRDLDARGKGSTESIILDDRIAAPRRRVESRMLGLLVFLLLAAGGVAYMVLSGTPDKPPATLPKQLVAAPQAREVSVQRPVSAAPGIHAAPAVAAVPSVLVETPPTLVAVEPAPLAAAKAMPAPVAAPSPQPERPLPVHSVAAPMATMATPALKRAGSVATVASAPVAVAVEPAVVKKPIDITPEAEALQSYEEAQALRRAGKTDAAIGKYRLALERNPGLKNARIQLARLLQDNGQAEAALALLKAGYEQQPDDGLAIATGRLLADRGRREEALSWLERGREGLRPADHALMGALLSQSLRYEAAVKAYQRALAADSGQGGWQLGLGLALESVGRIEEAHVAYRNALERGEFKPDVIKFLQQKLGMPSQ